MVKDVRENFEPFISIVTPCFNSEEHLDSAIQSVLRQDYKNFEHIVIDGGSTDNTLSIAKSYSHITLINEPGSGIYDAVNIGIRTAKGELIGWLNSDDEYASDFFHKASEEFKATPYLDVLYGDGAIFKEDQEQERFIIQRHKLGEEDDLNRGELRGTNAFLNCALFNSKLYDKIGYFETKYKISSDKEWFLRLFVEKPTVKRVMDISYLARRHEGSLTFSGEPNLKIKEIVAFSGREICSKYLKQPLTPVGVKLFCKGLVRLRTLQLIRLQLKKRKLLYASEICMEQIMKDPGFGFCLVKKAVFKTSNYSKKILKRIKASF